MSAPSNRSITTRISFQRRRGLHNLDVSFSCTSFQQTLARGTLRGQSTFHVFVKFFWNSTSVGRSSPRSSFVYSQRPKTCFESRMASRASCFTETREKRRFFRTVIRQISIKIHGDQDQSRGDCDPSNSMEPLGGTSRSKKGRFTPRFFLVPKG